MIWNPFASLAGRPTPVPLDVESPWSPLSVEEVMTLMEGAPFFWCLAGGHAIELVVGESYRSHEDIDVVVLRGDLMAVQQHFAGWELFAADPPGSLRRWAAGAPLPWRVHDVWTHRAHARAWELQLMIQGADGASWYFRRDDRVHGSIDDLAIKIEGVPCLRMDLQLLYKAKSSRPKDEEDFERLLPRLGEAERLTLLEWLRLTCPNGHHWIEPLEG